MKELVVAVIVVVVVALILVETVATTAGPVAVTMEVESMKLFVV